jgi:hypothetical protein
MLNLPSLVLQIGMDAVRLIRPTRQANLPVNGRLGMLHATACSHSFAGHYAEALPWAQAATRRQPNYAPAFRIQVASRAMTGQQEQARTAVTSLRKLYPLLRVSKLEELFPLRQSEDIARWAEGLRKAGLPE